MARIVPVLKLDLAPIFAEKWVDTLLNQLRSTSGTVRAAALDLWRALAAVCKDEKSLVDISAHVAKQLTTGKVSSWEHRVLTFDALASLAQTAKPAVSEKALEGYLTMIAKESNEQAMTSAIDGLFVLFLTACNSSPSFLLVATNFLHLYQILLRLLAGILRP